MRNLKLIIAASIIILFSLVSFSVAEECTTITLHYNERPPYQVPSGNSVTGLTADPAAKAFEKTGIKFEWKSTPSKRQTVTIQNNSGCDCGVGWFKNPEREKFALFTSPIYKDKPQVAIVRSDEARIKDGAKLEDILSNKDLKFLIKDGYSYGLVLDEKIAKFGKNVEKTTAENINMIKMIEKKRCDYFILAPEEAESLVTAAGFKMTQFKLINFSDMPEGNYRHIMCSKNVGESVINQLNDALPQIAPDK
ncbi:MAG: hypothetical protein C0403_14495 [Desulfobacterium sp.]|nr:hypothetical protein [Desulfobacterium sp.]